MIKKVHKNLPYKHYNTMGNKKQERRKNGRKMERQAGLEDEEQPNQAEGPRKQARQKRPLHFARDERNAGQRRNAAGIQDSGRRTNRRKEGEGMRLPDIHADNLVLFDVYNKYLALTARQIQENFKCCKQTRFNIVRYCREYAEKKGRPIYGNQARLYVPTALLFEVYGWDIEEITQRRNALAGGRK